ncbi:MAG: Flp family type IVb pilin [Hyphomonadaceae bacterium]
MSSQAPPAPDKTSFSIEMGLAAALIGVVLVSLVTAFGSSVDTEFTPAPQTFDADWRDPAG